MTALRVLLTNAFLSNFAGTEIVIRELALGLRGRGHRPMVYSRLLGPLALQIADAGIPIVDDLAKLPEPPDVIHAQHHPPAVEALLRFPRTPALYYAHDRFTWLDVPPLFPKILRYVAVDDAVLERLTEEPRIPRNRISVIRNSVNLDRFAPRGPLPSRPLRVLCYSKNAGHADAIRAACTQAGLDMDIAGNGFGMPTATPEDLLPKYDLIFASARGALEALACGAAVVACDARGFAGMVTSARFDAWRALNFGIRTFQPTPSPESIAAELALYDPVDAARVSQRVRQECGQEAQLDALVALYEEILEEDRSGPVVTLEATAAAAAEYVGQWLPRFHDPRQDKPQTLELHAVHQAHLGEMTSLRIELKRVVRISEESLRELNQVRSAHEEAVRGIADLRTELARVVREAHATLQDLDRLRGIHEGTFREMADLRSERDRVAADLRAIQSLRSYRLRARLARLPVVLKACSGILQFLERLRGSTDASKPAAGGPPPMPFIVGVARSGTTLLRLMLDAHPQLSIPAETGFVTALADAGPAAADPDVFFRIVTGFPTWEDFSLDAGDFRQALAGLNPFSVGAGVRLFYRLYASRSGKVRSGDKTPDFVQHLRQVEELMPEAHFVHVIRDGRDVALSLRGQWFSPGDSAEALAGHWAGTIRAARHEGALCRKYIEVRFEKLVRDPEGELKKVCRFIDLPFDPVMLDYHRTAAARLEEVRTRRDAEGRIVITKEQRLHNQRFTTRPPDETRIGRWRTEMSREDLGAFESVAGDMLDELGYERGFRG